MGRIVHLAAIRGAMTPLPNALAPGDLRYVYLHWTAGDYATVFDAYHVCIARDAADLPVVRFTHDLRDNMRDVRAGDGPYAAHTAGRNSYAIGVAVCGMADATPADFGAYPLREDQIALACETIATLCRVYRIPVTAPRVRTHAEAAVEDGYFGCDDGERWDVARLIRSDAPLDPAEAAAIGDLFRARIVAAER